MIKQVMSDLSWLSFLLVKVENPEKEEDLIDFGEPDYPFPQQTYYPRQECIDPPPSYPDGFHCRLENSNLSAQLQQLKNRLEACEMTNHELKTQLSEIQVEINDFYQNQSGPGNPNEVEMDVDQKELSNPIMPCTMSHLNGV